MTTDITEKGLETLIVRHMTGADGLAVDPNRLAETPVSCGGTGYANGNTQDYDRAYALDVPQLFAFLRTSQSEVFKKLAMSDPNDAKNINRLKFLARLSGEIGKRGVIGSSTGLSTLTFFTARHHRIILEPQRFTVRTASLSPGNLHTATTRRAGLLT